MSEETNDPSSDKNKGLRFRDGIQNPADKDSAKLDLKSLLNSKPFSAPYHFRVETPSENKAQEKPPLIYQKPEPEKPLPPPPKAPLPKMDDAQFSALLDRLKISRAEFAELVRFQKNNETRNRIAVFLLGVFLTPVTLAGSLFGFARSYNRFSRIKRLYPDFYPLKPITRVAMLLGAVLAWLIMLCGLLLAYMAIYSGSVTEALVVSYLTTNFILSMIVFGVFKAWQYGIGNKLIEDNKFGSARFAREDELESLKTGKGFYIGKDCHFNDKGHLLTVAGTRGGKGTNIIIPNLLGAGNIETSWVVIDPKGENAAITGNYQRESGKNVVILNPWGLLEDSTGAAQSYNPLDMLADKSSPHLVDDVQMISEMIVPIEAGSTDSFWTDSARTVIAGLLLHLVTSQPKQDCTLATLWRWVRLYGDDWDRLVQDMALCDEPVNGMVVANASNEILKLSAAGDETFGGIIANVLQATDFLKSPPLQKALESGFDPKVLADGNTTVYVIIPADKLRSHGRWLRLVITSMIRSVIRKPAKRVTFLLDEFAALGYLPEIETALSTYAGYNVTIWPILQSLVQLQAIYGKNWQSFTANCTVRQYFSINDNESAEYISSAIGNTSHTITTRSWFGIKSANATARALITPDELRRESGKKIFMFVGDLPPTNIEKSPYYFEDMLFNRSDKNPYL